ncbi:MAG: hypothetical protein QOJ88_843 [Pyrinomonadaceae bacterium]|jgi:hypothetical protein|nr:hypothetical protein [Pyrinomonadaceae bacterium]
MTRHDRLMANGNTKLLPLLPAAFLLFSAAVFAVAQQTPGVKQNVRPATPAAASPAPAPARLPEIDPARYFYEFTQPQFYVRHIRIEHDANGRGVIKFERLNDETVYEEPVELSAAAWTRISSLWQSLHFLDSDENYQSDRQFPHLGTMRLKLERGGHQRTAEFNWSNNKDAFALVNEYRRIADQAILIFDISLARELQPLNAPKLMEEFELQLKRNGFSDPEQLIPLLHDLSTDEHIPLIARNHALRLLKKIEK